MNRSDDMRTILESIEEKKILTKDEDPCWDGYRMYGMKNKNGKEVPNCIPESDSGSTQPIEAAVMPLKKEAVERAEIEANKIINRVIKDLEEADWDLDVAAPRGDSFYDGRNQYLEKQAKHNLYKSLTTFVKPSRMRGDPNLRKQSPEAEQHFIEDAKRDAAEQYDLFVGKLKAKIGPVQDANLQGSHVWGHSILTVTKPDGTREKWKTQQIVNVSKLGKLFNQWPTRKIKMKQTEEETYNGNEFFEAYGYIEYSEENLMEAEYQGRKVKLNKPMRGDVKKFKVYVKDPQTGNVKKVNFGDPDMKIKKSIPARRKSFRARHNCDNPGPKTKARYWSCRMW